MKKMLVLLLTLSVALVYAQESKAEYTGSKKCKICHNKAEDGAQYSIWEASPHAKSLETLKTDAAKAIAKKKGLKTAPEQSPECLSCHVTGWGSESGYKLNVDPLDSKAVRTNEDLSAVGCESCHGAGSLYKSKKTMIAITDGSIKGETVGLTTITAKTCTVCHNPESPTYKPFDYAVRVKEVAHPAPGK
ncbi:MAG: cytochrome c family protein [Candidatus Marinimicrobia bacterium]|nr:cytochrome c family protein [Candidatus Neomarinimicrobiota bacterium]MCF7923310.1 cytochrome c family protein [Candidatus Neomarinimicrobiota bacterium]